MGLFQTLKDRIFKSDEAKEVEARKAKTPAAAPAATPNRSPAPAASPTPTASAPAQPAQPVDLEKVLEYMEEKSGQKLNWRTSIVDLMKLVGMDSSLAARKELAQDLGYSGDMNDSASMNIWLHKQVMEKLAKTRS